MEEIKDYNMEATSPSRIKVFGVGGGGSNAVARMYQEGMKDVELYIVNTDLQHLNMLPVPNKIHIGETVTKGLGAGSKPEIGEEAAKENLDKIKEAMEGADMIFIAAGLGGGTGTGAAPVIAQAAKEMGILTVAVVSIPFDFEGPKRKEIALKGLDRLKDVVDTYLVINNQKLAIIAGKRFTFAEAFKLVDDILYKAVRGITDIIYKPGIINVDFADVKTIMEDGGKALIGVGSGKGETKIEDAVHYATNSPLLEGISIKGAKKLLINVEISPDLAYADVEEAIAQIKESAHEDAHIIFGASIDPSMEDEMRITVVATALEQDEGEKRVSKPEEPRKLKRRPITKLREEETVEEREPRKRLIDETIYDELEIPTYLRKKKRRDEDSDI